MKGAFFGSFPTSAGSLAGFSLVVGVIVDFGRDSQTTERAARTGRICRLSPRMFA